MWCVGTLKSMCNTEKQVVAECTSASCDNTLYIHTAHTVKTISHSPRSQKTCWTTHPSRALILTGYMTTQNQYASIQSHKGEATELQSDTQCYPQTGRLWLLTAVPQLITFHCTCTVGTFTDIVTLHSVYVCRAETMHESKACTHWITVSLNQPHNYTQSKDRKTHIGIGEQTGSCTK